MITVSKTGSAETRLVEFRLAGNPDQVACIAGSFNDWDPAATRMPYDPKEQCFLLTMELAPGYYEYKFVIDGQWIMDETNHNFASNDFGTLNSVLAVE